MIKHNNTILVVKEFSKNANSDYNRRTLLHQLLNNLSVEDQNTFKNMFIYCYSHTADLNHTSAGRSWTPFQFYPTLLHKDDELTVKAIYEQFESLFSGCQFKVFIPEEPQEQEILVMKEYLKSLASRGYYGRNGMTPEVIDKLENIVYLYITEEDYYFDSNYISVFPPELINHINSKKEILDFTSIHSQSPHLNLFCNFINTNTNDVFTQRNDVCRFKSTSIAKLVNGTTIPVISDLTFISDDTLFKQAYQEQELYIVKYKSLLRGPADPRESKSIHGSQSFTTGYGFFFLKIKLPYREITLNEDSNLIERKDVFFYFMATFSDISTIRKYTKAKRFLTSTINKISIYKGYYFYDRNKYEEEVKKIFGVHSTYSNQIRSIFPNQASPSNYKDILFNSRIEQTPKDYNLSFEYLNKIRADKNTNKLLNLNTKIKEIETKQQAQELYVTNAPNQLQNWQRNIVQNQAYIENLKNRIEEYQETLATLNQQINQQEENLKKANKEIKDTTNVLAHLKPQRESIVELIQDSTSVDKVTSSISGQNSFLKNLNNQGIIIESIFYQNPQGDLIDLYTDPKICFNTKFNRLINLDETATSKLHSIKFKIIKPVIIRVDYNEKLENCKKVVAGPYYVELTSDSILLSPLSSNFVFGFDMGHKRLWLHPHVNYTTINRADTDSFISELMSTRQRGCLGEASSAIYKAFQAQDFRQAILAAMTWITSANSSDTWGKNWKYFPKLSEITSMDIETKSINIVEESLQDKDLIIDNLFEDNENQTYETEEARLLEALTRSTEEVESEVETLNLATQQEETQEELPSDNEETPNEQQNTTPNNQLRSPGVPNYTPYGFNT
jgi:hypothetical protein